MKGDQIQLFVLGATGFVGNEVVKEALARGVRVTALVRTAGKAEGLASLGARIVLGDARKPADWIHEAAGCDVILDLLQPELPRRIGLRDIRRIAGERRAMTHDLVAAMQTIAKQDRPLLLSVSGVDDLAPNAQGRIAADSPLRSELSGFAHIGVPVRRLIEESGVACAFAYLGTVYGPGKSFAKTIFPQLEAGRFRLPGQGANRMAVVHVEDAARALVHLAALGTGQVSGRTFVITDGQPATMAEFFGFAASCLKARRPRSAPLALVRLLTGSVLFETLTRDVATDPAALVETGFVFKYPTYREGLPPSIEHLGYPHAQKPVSILDRRGVFGALLVLAVSAFLAENLLHFPLSVPYMKELANGAPMLDLRIGYRSEAAYHFFDVLGKTGRSAYLHLLWSIDVVLPALFGFFLSGAIRRGPFRAWRSIPLLGTAFDYAENIAITILLLRYPLLHPALVRIACVLTIAKLAFYAAGGVLAAGGLLVRWLRPGSQAMRADPVVDPR
jgi:nucleoside-diphosphate-sugar epimerase